MDEVVVVSGCQDDSCIRVRAELLGEREHVDHLHELVEYLEAELEKLDVDPLWLIGMRRFLRKLLWLARPKAPRRRVRRLTG